MDVEKTPPPKDVREITLTKKEISLSSGPSRVQQLRRDTAEANRLAAQKRSNRKNFPLVKNLVSKSKGSGPLEVSPSLVATQANPQLQVKTMANPQRVALGHKLASVQMFDGRWVTYRRIYIDGIGYGYQPLDRFDPTAAAWDSWDLLVLALTKVGLSPPKLPKD